RSPRPRRRARAATRSAAGTPTRARTPSCRSRRALATDPLQQTVAWGCRCSLDVVFVPEREREQTPQLPAQVLSPLHVVVEQARDGVRPEEPLPPQPFRRQRLACERLQLAAQPGRGGNREAALLSVHDLTGQQRLGRLS